MTPVFELCARYVDRLAEFDPVFATMRGVETEFRPATDFGPDGHAAREDLVRSTLAELATLEPTSDADRGAAAYLRERLESQAAWYDLGEPVRDLRALFGTMHIVHDNASMLPRGDDERWHRIATRLAAVPEMLASWRRSLDLGIERGTTAARRQAVEGAAQADSYVGSHEELVRSYGDGPLAGDLARAARAADAGYTDLARYLRETYAPRATEVDAVGAERYAVAARGSLGADLDAREAYEWGWAELERIEAELAVEAGHIKPGATIDEAMALLDASEFVDGEDAYREWLQDKHDWAIRQLHGVHFDIAEPLHTVEVVLATGSNSGAAYYTSPSEDLSRPGRTWWPTGGRTRFETWSELSTVYHEGVPGHHLQNGACRIAGDSLSRFAKVTGVSGYGEGWALYAERLADELGWFTDRGTRLGMLTGSSLRAARVVLDIGVHLDLPMPDGSRWTFENACRFLRDRGRAEPHRVHAEVVRYFGWPAQAISYKLGERAFLAARAEAQRRPGFDLKRWHTDLLNLGPVGLDQLRETLRHVG
ncbi:DUF885 domain-containing protein [Virgisporangium ochraceum]|uniref:DUF885 domain-containing protein n=1 Tax=Virgisporangium ochraceum TaxID=65505 RepID=A0A8J4EEK4_9ACTN|nr:DUF885 domain-containing protein [Virgisporangium ochraceum]GIJ69117.1 hypothetical protein Voc01_040340 [Virgisporangium ochraceum]